MALPLDKPVLSAFMIGRTGYFEMIDHLRHQNRGGAG